MLYLLPAGLSCEDRFRCFPSPLSSLAVKTESGGKGTVTNRCRKRSHQTPDQTHILPSLPQPLLSLAGYTLINPEERRAQHGEGETIPRHSSGVSLGEAAAAFPLCLTRYRLRGIAALLLPPLSPLLCS